MIGDDHVVISWLQFYAGDRVTQPSFDAVPRDGVSVPLRDHKTDPWRSWSSWGSDHLEPVFAMPVSLC